MLRKNLLTIIGCLLFLAFLVQTLAGPQRALGQMTIPTRTPVPDPDQPTAEPTDDSGGGGGGGNGGQAPPATPEPAATEATGAELPATAEPTVAQAALCGVPPTYTASLVTAVLAGPGADTAILARLGVGEVRQIIGRAAGGSWWLISLGSNGLSGWVRDQTGLVHGYTGALPITPNSGENIPNWVPTADARCIPGQPIDVHLVWLPNPLFPRITFQIGSTGNWRYLSLEEIRRDLSGGVANN